MKSLMILLSLSAVTAFAGTQGSGQNSVPSMGKVTFEEAKADCQGKTVSWNQISASTFDVACLRTRVLFDTAAVSKQARISVPTSTEQMVVTVKSNKYDVYDLSTDVYAYQQNEGMGSQNCIMISKSVETFKTPSMSFSCDELLKYDSLEAMCDTSNTGSKVARMYADAVAKGKTNIVSVQNVDSWESCAAYDDGYQGKN